MPLFQDNPASADILPRSLRPNECGLDILGFQSDNVLYVLTTLGASIWRLMLLSAEYGTECIYNAGLSFGVCEDCVAGGSAELSCELERFSEEIMLQLCATLVRDYSYEMRTAASYFRWSFTGNYEKAFSIRGSLWSMIIVCLSSFSTPLEQPLLR
jgi:hypothetical protein